MPRFLTAYAMLCTHGGWCSGEECEITRIKKGIMVPEDLNMIPFFERLQEWSACLPYRYLCFRFSRLVEGGSGYCDLSSESKALGFYGHDYMIYRLVLSQDDMVLAEMSCKLFPDIHRCARVGEACDELYHEEWRIANDNANEAIASDEEAA